MSPTADLPSRQATDAILHEHVADANLRRHMYAVEAAMRWYAETLGHDADRWGMAGLLHDFDWEIHPSIERHPKEGAPILRQRGVPDDVVQAILAHNPVGTGVTCEAPMDYALMACDEITGLIIAATFVRPHKDVRQLKVKSIKRNWKDKPFAAGVDRDEVREATEEFSQQCFDGKLELWQHIGNVLEAMKGAAERLELDGRMAG